MTSETIAYIGIIQMPLTITAIVLWYRWKVKQSKKSWFDGREPSELTLHPVTDGYRGIRRNLRKDHAILRGSNKDKDYTNI